MGARDIVRHMVEWMPALCLEGPGLEVPKVPSVDDDPVGAWVGISDALQAALDDPEVATREFDMRAGRVSVEYAIDTFCVGDIVMHTWDLARATGLDETLDPDEVHSMYEGMLPMDEVLRAERPLRPESRSPRRRRRTNQAHRLHGKNSLTRRSQLVAICNASVPFRNLLPCRTPRRRW